MKMNMMRTVMSIVAGVASLMLSAADPGGRPGLVKAVFTGSAFNSTGDVQANAVGYTLYPEEMYATACPENTTYAWAGYMKMTGGVTYQFKGCYDDYVTVKIAGGWVLSPGGECKERTGSYTPSVTDWYAVEFRVGNNGGEGGLRKSTQYGILWKTGADADWRKVQEYGGGAVFKTGRTDLKLDKTTPIVLSSQMRKTDPTVMDVAYIVLSPHNTVDVRALAFEDGERSFWKAVRVTELVNDPDGNPTAQNIGDSIAANVSHTLAWKVSKDWKTDLAKVKFEVMCSDQAQLPLKLQTIPATAKNPAITIGYGTQTDADIFNALLWHYADGAKDIINTDGYLDLDHPYANQVDTANIRIVNRTTIANRMEALRYLYDKLGFEALDGGNLLDYVRKATRKDLWFNSGTQNAVVLKSSKPEQLYVGEKAYCVIDVSGGPDAETYPVSYLDYEPMAGWSDEYKTTKILLRRCEAGKYMMRKNKEVTFTKPFYIGIFTVTQKQYQQVMGTNPTPSNHQGDMRPVEISWNAIRGNSATYNWPTVRTVDPSTFVGKIQAKTGLNFDLPTEAQWEYACRAGTSSKYNNGGSEGSDYCDAGNKDVSVLARCWTDRPVDVGLFKPNFWGIYDMHGNVGQWCLDYSDGYNSDPAIDYEGAESGSGRVIRGYRHYGSYYATSFYRYGVAPSDNRYRWNTYFYLGFRLSRTLSE